jgi:hypothetical protein
LIECCSKNKQLEEQLSDVEKRISDIIHVTEDTQLHTDYLLRIRTKISEILDSLLGEGVRTILFISYLQGGKVIAHWKNSCTFGSPHRTKLLIRIRRGGRRGTPAFALLFIFRLDITGTFLFFLS